MAARSSRKDQSLDEVLGQFTARLDQTARFSNINRYVPLPEQELFHQSQAKGRILFGGNRGGKTFGGIADDVMILTRKHPHRSHMYPSAGEPIRMRFIGVDFDRGITQGAIPLFQRLLPASALINGNWSDSYSESQKMLTLDDGSTVSFMSYEQDANKFQVVSLHHIHFDEEPPKPIFQESMLRLLDVAGTWTLSETPVQQLEWVQDELIDPSEAGLRPDISINYLDTRANVNLPPEELIALELTLTEEEKTIRLAGRYPGGSLVFPEFERKAPFVIPHSSFTLSSEWAVYESMDHGYVNPTAWLWHAVHPDGSIITFKSLYAKNIVVSEWAALVLGMRQQICREYGIPYHFFLSDMLKGTFGDPAIGDQGNASAQTGLTHQQTYALGGVNIATGGIRAARQGNQNVGLDKMHGYLRPRPASHPRGPLPWWQITDDNTSLIDEMKKARKPRQSLTNKEVKNASEQIRDKDNHAIDAAKYFFIITHDLRPTSYQEDLSQYSKMMGEQLGAVSTQADTHAQVFSATIASAAQWSYHASDSYFAMEE